MCSTYAFLHKNNAGRVELNKSGSKIRNCIFKKWLLYLYYHNTIMCLRNFYFSIYYVLTLINSFGLLSGLVGFAELQKTSLLTPSSGFAVSACQTPYGEKNPLGFNVGLRCYMSRLKCYLDISFSKTNTGGCCVYQQKTFLGPIRWLKPVSKHFQRRGCAHTCMMGMLVLLPLPCFSSSSSSSCFSSLAVACLTKGYELYCLLSGLVLGCVWAWLTEVLQGYSSQSSWFAGSQRVHRGRAALLCRSKVFSVFSSLSNQPAA